MLLKEYLKGKNGLKYIDPYSILGTTCLGVNTDCVLNLSIFIPLMAESEIMVYIENDYFRITVLF